VLPSTDLSPYPRRVRLSILAPLVLLLVWSGSGADAASAKVIKVLPHLIDREGRHTLSPSLYERDAYQAHLRQHPELQAGLRFDVQWKARRVSQPRLLVEMRGANSKEPTSVRVEQPLKPGGLFSKWSDAHLSGEDYKKFGNLIAWRVSLWDGRNLLAEQTSFLW
jgi:hypothetical protein